MTRRLIIFTMALLVVVGCMVGLQADNDNGEAAEQAKRAQELAKIAQEGRAAKIEGEPTIGLTISTLGNMGWIGIYTGVLQAVAEEDCGLITFSARNDVETQVRQMEDFITKGVDAIILNPVNTAALSKSVFKANSAGIPVVTLDRSTEEGKVYAEVTSDNVEAGEMAGQAMAAFAVGKKLKILNITGDLGTSAGEERDRGFMNVVDKYDSLEVVSRLTANWDPPQAQAATLDAFQAHPEINAIYLPSDNAYAQAVLQALKQLGKLYKRGELGHIVITTVDGGPVALENIRKGYIEASAMQQLFFMGKESLRAAVSAAKGEKREKVEEHLAPLLILKDNADNPYLWGNLLSKVLQ